MDMLYAKATVMLCRSGGMTAELAAVGMPSILVPLPGAPGDHQTRNAEVFARAGAAVMVPDSEVDGARFRSELEAMLIDLPRLSAMSEAARALARTDATERFADLVEEVARGR
jgi:UDP-N-acetylglucosamine--N-acetylmuramyl-(pentapeptide) pyrophosphoryl-undecaprenol N-acetylglucosamine transferase